MKCPECGGTIIFDYIVPKKTFSLNENNELKRVDQNEILQPAGDTPYTIFRCENDYEHNIETAEIITWVNKVEKRFYEKKNIISKDLAQKGLYTFFKEQNNE